MGVLYPSRHSMMLAHVSLLLYGILYHTLRQLMYHLLTCTPLLLLFILIGRAAINM